MGIFELILRILTMFVALAFGLAAAFVPQTTLLPARAVVSHAGEVSMFFGGKKSAPKKVAKRGVASPTKPKVGPKPKPLSPGSNYPTTKNIQTQSSGFGSFLAKFELTKGKSKYGMPVFLPNGNVNPAYLAAERKAIAAQSRKNVQAEAAKTKKMKAKKTFALDDFIRKKVGNVGSGKEYYQSGR